MLPLLQVFGETAIRGELPEVLPLREETYTMFLVAILSFSFLLISFSRSSNSRALQSVAEVFFRDSSSVEVYLKENMKIGSWSSITLIINYFISFSLCNFIFFHRILLVRDDLSMLLSFSIPIILFGLETLGLYLAGSLSGEMKRLHVPVLNTLTVSQFSGLLFSIIALFWIMNPNADKLFLSLYLALICLKSITRVLKNSTNVLSSGVRWYYLMLYFCTLEILPLFVGVYYVVKNFL